MAGEDAQPDTAAEPANPIEQRYLDAVSTVESAGGAYDPALSQYLLGLGIAYQNDGKHAEALTWSAAPLAPRATEPADCRVPPHADDIKRGDWKLPVHTFTLRDVSHAGT